MVEIGKLIGEHETTMIKKIKILIVDDDKDIIQVLRLSFSCLKVILFEASNGLTAIDIAKIESPDIVILDVNMPDMEGTEVCRTIRGIINCHIIFLSANDEEIDKVFALEIGGDDYMTKPFSTRELNAKIKSVIRRLDYHSSEKLKTESLNSISQYGSLTIDQSQHLVRWKQTVIDLTAIEFNILLTFIANPNKTFSKDQLIAQSYEQNISVSHGTIDSHIGHIRAKFKPHKANLITTVHGIGYRLTACELSNPVL